MRDAISIESYPDALLWLRRNLPHHVIDGVIVRGLPLSVSMRLVCDLFWVPEARLRRDLSEGWIMPHHIEQRQPTYRRRHLRGAR